MVKVYASNRLILRMGNLLVILLFNLFIIKAQTSQISAKSNVVYINYTVKEEHLIEQVEVKKNERLGTNSPVIRYINPRVEGTDQIKEITSQLKTYVLEGFTYTNDGSGIKYLTVNDEEVKLDNNDYFDKLLILKPGENMVSIKSSSNLGNICYDTIKITYKKPESKNYIVSIAVDKYKHWSKLEYAVDNATELADVLTNKYTFNTSERIDLFNEDATAEKIYSTLRELVNSLGENDNLVIYFAGHGYYAEDIQEGFWVPYNGRDDTPSDYISNSEIIKFLKALKSKHVLLISDACFSGSFFASAERGINEVSFENFEKRPSRWAFSSGMLEKVADNSPFCKYIVKYLKENEAETLLFSDLKEYVISSVGSNSNQMPMAGPLKYVNHQGGQFVFHLRGKEK